MFLEIQEHYGGFYMDKSEYKQYIMETITNEYPRYLQRKVLNQLINNKILINKKGGFSEELIKTGKVDVSAITDIKDKLLVAINQSDEVIKQIETFEFQKSYRYCTILNYTNLNEATINELIEKGNILPYSEDNTNFDYIANDIIDIPTMRVLDDKIILKFNMGRTSVDEQQNIKRIKYPVLVVLFKELNILEIRFDVLRLDFKNTEDFYSRLINGTLAWLKRFMNIGVTCIDFRPVEKFIEANRDDVILYAQALKTNSGSKVVLDIDADEECILPILGGLKNLMKEYEEDFNAAPKVKGLLEDFIQEIKDTSDSEWCKLYWKEKFDSDGILITINHTYKQEDFSLIQYHKNLKDMERMDYVTRYLIECKGEVDKQQIT